jgi:3-hydroxyisobutyrate dehydrogenase-like beta-hydroxyacid dehydrogenase
MGSQVARVLLEGGKRVVTSLHGRSGRTERQAQEAGLEVLDSLEAVAQQAALIVSVVPSAAAEPLAEGVAAAIRRGSSQPLYLDANSIAPSTALRIERALSAAGGRYVDGAIIGAARDLRGRTRFYLSGAEAAQVAALLDPPLNTTILGRKPGQASAFKVLYAGLTKGLSALGVELLAGAERLGLREQRFAPPLMLSVRLPAHRARMCR